MTETSWQWSDAWLLMAIHHAGGDKGVTLLSILGAGDMMNHSIFNLEELRNGTTRLEAAGLVRIKEGSFYLTKKIRTVCDAAIKEIRTIIPIIDHIHVLLQEVPLDKNKFTSLPAGLLTKKSLEKAVKEYNEL